ncbi:MAG: hypothetical protein M0004_03905 [Actinomycetota bacterium]|nr:hypothetical protein [Actinomycetota bacterium]
MRRPLRAIRARRWPRRAAPIAALVALALGALLGVHLASPAGAGAHPPRSIVLPRATPTTATSPPQAKSGVSRTHPGSGASRPSGRHLAGGGATTTTSLPSPQTTSPEAGATGEGAGRVTVVAPRRAVVVSDDAGDHHHGGGARTPAADSGDSGG